METTNPEQYLTCLSRGENFFYQLNQRFFLGPVFLTLGGVRCFSGCKIFRALRARSPWRSWFVGGFWNQSALWWGQFDEMDKFLAFGQHQGPSDPAD